MAKASAKKRWFKILAPRVFNNTVVGETAALEPKIIVGKTLKANLSTLVNDMRKQNSEVGLLVDNVEGDTATTSIIGYRVLPNYLKRLVRKGRTRHDLTVKGITKDEKVVTVKTLVITRNRVKGSVFTAIQEDTKNFIIKKISSLNYNELAEIVVTGRLWQEMKKRLDKIYPVRTCEVREFKLERFLKSVDLRKIKAELAKPKKVESKNTEDAEEMTEEGEEKPKKNAEETESEEQEEVSEDVSDEETEEKTDDESEETDDSSEESSEDDSKKSN